MSYENYKNPDKRKTYLKKWRKKNLTHIRLYLRQWRAKNPDYYKRENRFGKEELQTCREKDKEYQRIRRVDFPELKAEENRKYREKRKERITVNSTVTRALKTGKIQRSKCKFCDRKDTHAHHKDYSKPLSIVWLCPVHHKKLHTNKLSTKAKV